MTAWRPECYLCIKAHQGYEVKQASTLLKGTALCRTHAREVHSEFLGR